MQEIKGKVAAITGAASGIGRALATQLVDAGAAVILADIQSDALAFTAQALRDSGGDVEAVVTDVTDPRSVADFADKAFSHNGHVDIVFANVGVMTRNYAPLWEIPLDEWHRILGINTFGVIHTLDAFLPRMIESNQEGHLVVTSSMAGVTAAAVTSAPYLASKHATRAIGEMLRRNLQEIDSPLRVSVLCPGPVRTAMLEHVSDINPQWHDAHTAMGGDGVLDAADVADQVLEAIRDERFFIFTHDDSRRRVTDWFDSITSDLAHP